MHPNVKHLYIGFLKSKGFIGIYRYRDKDYRVEHGIGGSIIWTRILLDIKVLKYNNGEEYESIYGRM